MAETKAKDKVILLVDDEPSIINMNRLTLESEGYRILSASNGLQAVSMFYIVKNEMIDLAIMDLNMPVMDGLTAIEALRRTNPKIKIIVSSGFIKDSNEKEIRNLKVEASLLKPYSSDLLVQTVREVFGEK